MWWRTRGAAAEHDNYPSVFGDDARGGGGGGGAAAGAAASRVGDDTYARFRSSAVSLAVSVDLGAGGLADGHASGIAVDEAVKWSCANAGVAPPRRPAPQQTPSSTAAASAASVGPPGALIVVYGPQLKWLYKWVTTYQRIPPLPLPRKFMLDGEREQLPRLQSFLTDFKIAGIRARNLEAVLWCACAHSALPSTRASRSLTLVTLGAQAGTRQRACGWPFTTRWCSVPRSAWSPRSRRHSPRGACWFRRPAAHACGRCATACARSAACA